MKNIASENETALNLSYNCSITGSGWNSLDPNSKISISEKQIHSIQEFLNIKNMISTMHVFATNIYGL